jgi:hypothetical protein
MEKMEQCDVGHRLKDECSLHSFGTTSTEYKLFQECRNDITSHLKALGIDTSNLRECATEKWLIENRTNESFLDMHKICPKHRKKFGTAWRSSEKCQYPGHKGNNKTTKGRYISHNVAFEIKQMFSSVAQSFHIAVGSKWCNNCRLRIHPNLKKNNTILFQLDVCSVCSKHHQSALVCSSTPAPKRPRISTLRVPEGANDEDYFDNDASENFPEKVPRTPSTVLWLNWLVVIGAQ